MKPFAALVSALDQTAETSQKVIALAQYFETARDEDKLWAIALLSGQRPKRCVTMGTLLSWAAQQTGLPLWLLEETNSTVGDMAETIALVLPPATSVSNLGLSEWITDLIALASGDEAEKHAFVLRAWRSLPDAERFLVNKLITGGFRSSVSQKLRTQALSQATGKSKAELAHRLAGNWTPRTVSYHELIEAENPEADLSKPYPFHIASTLGDGPKHLGAPDEWHAEWSRDGIRAQVILRGGQHFVWSQSEEVMTHRFPELAQLNDALPPGTVLDGNILAWKDESPLPTAVLQKRLTRKTIPKTLLTEAPVILCASDLLEWNGDDIRARPFAERRALLEAALAHVPSTMPIRLSASLPFDDWEGLAAQRSKARSAHAEGLTLKRQASAYGTHHTEGDWQTWKRDPLTFTGVMIYAHSGQGQRAPMFTEFTFAVWNGGDLVPVTKANAGLTDAECRDITAWVRKNTLQRFGPVRQVPPEHVFEIAFDGIEVSPRRKSGVSLRNPRIVRWCHDKSEQDVNTLDDLKQMLRLKG